MKFCHNICDNRWNETAAKQARRLRFDEIADLLDSYMVHYQQTGSGRGFRSLERRLNNLSVSSFDGRLPEEQSELNIRCDTTSQ